MCVSVVWADIRNIPQNFKINQDVVFMWSFSNNQAIVFRCASSHISTRSALDRDFP